MKKKGSVFENLALISQIGISMVVSIMISLYIGKWLDDRLGTGPVFLFIFIIIGIASAFMNVFKLIEREIRQKKRK
ncbi:AtpZ/AtpI family protein [Alkaliphilus sp. B6464]|uniref:AtpZ/AtpI family protein n=1 Tax=Alkaliphilus sp. B6464 TaxID=2731219 RepID=UPI001BA4EB3C|nr:AtpZ/AtpI family protein [Alkaliphilus sp. B6464]QUH19098.1 AtpZ/AtpI family protein [Alkaliphilus sp. B6464]